MSDDGRPLLETRQGSMTSKDAKWTATLNIWIGRFREAQQAIRAMEVELKQLQKTLDRFQTVWDEAVKFLTDEQLAELAVNVAEADKVARRL